MMSITKIMKGSSSQKDVNKKKVNITYEHNGCGTKVRKKSSGRINIEDKD